MRCLQSRAGQRRSAAAPALMRIIACAGLLCGLWISQSQLRAQYGQMPPSAMPSAPVTSAPNAPNMAAGGYASAPGGAVPGAQSSTGAGNEVAADPNSATIPMTSLFGAIREGGVMMIPIIACSFALMVFIFERLLYMRRNRVIPRPFIRGVIEQLEQQQLDRDEAIALCEENGSLTADLFMAALKRYGRPTIEVEQAVLDAGERVTNSLRSYLRLFSTISNVTPLLGLLGTVLGMIEAFNAIAQSGAMGRPELLAGGIGEALLTTAAGLFVAIPAYTAYAFFLARADKLIIEMDTHVQRVIELVSAEGLQESGRSRNRSRRAAA